MFVQTGNSNAVNWRQLSHATRDCVWRDTFRVLSFIWFSHIDRFPRNSALVIKWTFSSELKRKCCRTLEKGGKRRWRETEQRVLTDDNRKHTCARTHTQTHGGRKKRTGTKYRGGCRYPHTLSRDVPYGWYVLRANVLACKNYFIRHKTADHRN